MNLGQAYLGWQQQSQNRELYLKTREAFRKAWFALPTNKPCSYYTKEVLGEALAATREIESNKTKAASVMVHVLTFAAWAEPKFNPKPDFTYMDLMEYTKGPLADPEKIAVKRDQDDEGPGASGKAKPEKRPSCLDDYDDDNDLDIDPVTAMPRKPVDLGPVDVVNVRERATVPDLDVKRIASKKPLMPCDEHGRPIPGDPCVIVPVALDDDPLAGIDFPDVQEETKPEEDMKPKEKKPRGRQPKPVVQIDPKMLIVVKVWPSLSQAQRELSLTHIDVAVQKMRKCGGFYWSLASDVETFKERLEEKNRQAEERLRQQAENMRRRKTSQAKKQADPSEPVKQAEDHGPVPNGPSEENQRRNAASDALKVFTDEELLGELERRGWHGDLSRTVIVTIGG